MRRGVSLSAACHRRVVAAVSRVLVPPALPVAAVLGAGGSACGAELCFLSNLQH